MNFLILELIHVHIEFIVNRYLKEDKPHGSAGGLYNFRDLLMEDSPVGIFTLLDYIFVMIMYKLLGNITTELVNGNIRIDQIWSEKSENISGATASSYLVISINMVVLSPLAVTYIFAELRRLLQFSFAWDAR